VTPKEIFTAFREDAHDPGTQEEEYLWKTPFLRRTLNEARMEAARRSDLILDGTTADTCRIKLTTDTRVYKIDKRVIRIMRVKHPDIDLPLQKLALRDADVYQPGWQRMEASEPCVWIPYGDWELYLTPPPNADYGTGNTLELMVVREPLNALTVDDDNDEDAIEIPKRYHFRLGDWMKGRAYMQQDLIEKYRPGEARDSFAMFEQEFGPASSALTETWAARKHGFDDYEGLL
jgi:hypothetical protein